MKRSFQSSTVVSTADQEKIKVYKLKYLLIDGSNITSLPAHGIDILVKFEIALANIKSTQQLSQLTIRQTLRGNDILIFQHPIDCFQLANEIQHRKWMNEPNITPLESQLSTLKRKQNKSGSDTAEISRLQTQLKAAKDKAAFFIEFNGVKVSVLYPDLVLSQTGSKQVDSYQDLAKKLTELSSTRPNTATSQLPYYDHYVAQDILAILQGKEPTHYPRNKQLLCEAAVLLFCVEPSRQEASFGISLLLLDLIANQRTYGSTLSKKPYLWRNTLDSAKLTASGWKTKVSTSDLNFYPGTTCPYGPSTAYQLIQYPPRGPRSKYIGGKSPVSTSVKSEVEIYNSKHSGSSISNAGIYSERSSLIKQMQQGSLNLVALERSIAHHRIMLKEISMLIHWLQQEHPLLTRRIIKPIDSPSSGGLLLQQFQHLFNCRLAIFYGTNLNLTSLIANSPPLSIEDANIINAIRIKNLDTLSLNQQSAQQILFVAGIEATPDFYLTLFKKVIEMNLLIDYVAQDQFGCTILHHLIMNNCNRENLIQIISSVPVDLFSANQLGETPLYLSLSHPDPLLTVNIIQILIDKKTNLNTQDPLGNIPLHYLIARPNQNELIKSYFKTYLEIYPSSENDLTIIPNQLGQLPIHIAAQTGNYFGAIFCHNKTTMQKSIHINMLDNNGNTPLVLALKNSADIKMIQFLTTINANPHLTNYEGKSAFHFAISQYLDASALNLLLRASTERIDDDLLRDLMKLSIKTNNFDALLLSWSYHPTISKNLTTNESYFKHLLLESDRPDNLNQLFQLTQFAIKFHDHDTFTFCMNTYPDLLHYRDNHGNYLLAIAVLNSNLTIVNNILSSKLNCNLANSQGNTALHLAAESCHDVDVLILLISKLDLNQKNNTYKTPLEIAKAVNNEAFITAYKEVQSKSQSSTLLLPPLSFTSLESTLMEISPQFNPSVVTPSPVVMSPVVSTTGSDTESSGKRIRIDTPSVSLPSVTESDSLMPIIPVTQLPTGSVTQMPSLTITSSLLPSGDLLHQPCSNSATQPPTYTPGEINALISTYCAGTSYYIADMNNSLIQQQLHQKLVQFKLDSAQAYGTKDGKWLFIPIYNNDNTWSLLSVNYHPTHANIPTAITYFNPVNAELPPALTRSLQAAFGNNIRIEHQQIPTDSTNVTVAELIHHISENRSTVNAVTSVASNIQNATTQQSAVLHPTTTSQNVLTLQQ